MNLKDKLWIIVTIFSVIVLVLVIRGIIETDKYNELENITGNFTCKDCSWLSNSSNDSNAYAIGKYEKPSLAIGNWKRPESAIQISNGNETTMKIYYNGSFWIKEGTEQYNGEQLAKVSISMSSYLNGYCEGLKDD